MTPHSCFRLPLCPPLLLISRLTLSPPPSPSSPSSLSHTIALSLSLPLSLFTQSDRGERTAWVASLSLYFILCFLSDSSDCHSAAETLQVNSPSSASEAGHRRGEDRSRNKLGISSKNCGVFCSFQAFLMIDLFRCLSSRRKDLKWET